MKNYLLEQRFLFLQKICLMIFLGISYPSFANNKLFPVDNGKVSAGVEQSEFQRLLNKPTGWKPGQENFGTRTAVKADIVGKAGQVSAEKVALEVEAKVAKKTVFKNLLSKAKLGGRALGVAGWLLIAYDLVSPILVQDGWIYDPEEKNWVRYDNAGFAVSKKDLPANKSLFIEDVCDSDNYECDGKHLFRSESYSESDLSSQADKACKKLKGDFSKRNKGWDGSYYSDVGEPYNGGKSTYDGRYACYIKTGSFNEDDVKTLESYRGIGIAQLYRVKNSKTPITQSQFDNLVEPHADKQPSSYVTASADEKGSIPGLEVSDDVDIKPGTIAQTNPYTNPETGQAEQTRWEFGRSPEGKTTVKETIMPRPDLNPNSKEAPKTDKQKDTDKKTEDKDETKKEDDKKDNKPESGLCDMFPGILACDKMGDVDEHDAPFNVPHVTNDTTFKPDYFLPDTGVCPSPESFNFWGKTYYLSYEPICRFAGMIRYLIIGVAGFIAARIMFSGLKQG